MKQNLQLVFKCRNAVCAVGTPKEVEVIKIN